MSGPPPVVDGGAAAAAPGGALHFGTGLRARHAATALRRPASVAGLPFATLGRRHAPPPVPAPRPAGPGLAWRALGAAPLREEPAAAAAPRPWRGALGQAPAAASAEGGTAGSGGGDADSPLPERLPAGPYGRGPESAAPFRPLPEVPVRGTREVRDVGGVGSVGGAAAGGELREEPRTAHGGAERDRGAETPRAVPVFPGLPERLVPAWAMGGGEGPASAGTHPPRVPLPVPLAPRPADPAGPARGPAGAMDVRTDGAPDAPPLPARAPQLAMAAPGEAAAADRIGAPTSDPPAGWGGANPRMDDAPPLTWASPAGPMDGAGKDGGRAAATPDARAFVDAAGFTPLAWPVPASGAVEALDAPAELPRLAWARPGGGASAGVAGTAGPAGPAGADGTEGGREPGPYAPTLLHGITLAAQSLATAVERRETVREARREAAEAARPFPPAPPPSAPAVDPTSDEVVRTLMRKMTAMAREERFRAGGLR